MWQGKNDFLQIFYKKVVFSRKESSKNLQIAKTVDPKPLKIKCYSVLGRFLDVKNQKKNTDNQIMDQ
jgi:hypothetical protein